MTEFVISATYVLIPLFIAVPMLAKYIDIKQAAVQAARYEAWEYTVWYEDDAMEDHDILDNYSSGIAGYLSPEKPLDSVRNESQRRIMSRDVPHFMNSQAASFSRSVASFCFCS